MEWSFKLTLFLKIKLNKYFFIFNLKFGGKVEKNETIFSGI